MAEEPEIELGDTKTSRSEEALKIVKAGYITLTVALGADWLKTVFIPGQSLVLGGELLTAWIAWTAGLIGWLTAKASNE